MIKKFIDTNVILYANDGRAPEKQKIAIDLIVSLMNSQEGVLSTQVLQEYAYAAMAKLNQAPEIVLRQIKLLEALEVVRQSPDMIRRAIEIMQTYKISFWDSCIISNAEFAGCSLIYSEDLNAGQYYSGIQIVNPF